MQTANLLRFVLLLALAVAAGTGAWAVLRPPAAGLSAEVIALQHEPDASGFQRAFAPRPFDFPTDHGPHVEYQTEWWYYTGNVQGVDGRRFGYQLTFFRRALSPEAATRSSEWATNQIYFAHFAVSDVSGNRHRSTERFSRGAAGLAGATGEPFRVWLENWSVESLNADGSAVRLRAADAPADAPAIALDLTLRSTKAAALHGEAGLSRKSARAGNASYYFSYTRLATEGNLTIGGESVPVNGFSWMDHEFGTTGLGPDAVGWDWFSLQLSDGRDLMLFQIRQKDGSIEPLSSGTLVEGDGTTRHVPIDRITIQPRERWTSPRTGGTYPAGWTVTIVSEGLVLMVHPLIADQEMNVSFKYWEGAVAISGTAHGVQIGGTGYVELTGYTGRPTR